MSFLASWLYGFCSIAFFVLLPPFITLWIGEEKLIDTMSLLLLSLNCFLLGTYAVYYRARNAKGNFGKDKWLAMNQAVVNLVVSVICARAMGLPGVYVGTVVSRLYTIISRPLRTYRFLFDASPREYYLRLAGYFLTVVTVGLATWLLCGMVLTEVTLLRFAAAVCTVAVVPNALFALAYFRTEECAALLYRVKDILGGRKK
jgi:O-antigen/teichoic acid export membrane protein